MAGTAANKQAVNAVEYFSVRNVDLKDRAETHNVILPPLASKNAVYEHQPFMGFLTALS
ncbi:hypothetical protein JCM17843_22690 [Kordiimonadales bacterium JCM 17843]|nr:hypothetical protein JCM17843_22690 [Kordiimonadales bacterium JCM 17843]